MDRYKKIFTLMVLTMFGSSGAWSHEGHDHSKKDKPEVSAAAAANPSAPVNVVVKLFQFQPARTQVGVGATVTWTNDDDIYHSVTAEQKSAGFDAPLDGKGNSFSFTFTQPGRFTYYCDRHEHMRGEIEVK
jgi:plastocyanin